MTPGKTRQRPARLMIKAIILLVFTSVTGIATAADNEVTRIDISQVPAGESSWQAQVQRITIQFVKRRNDLLARYQSRMKTVNAYQLSRIDLYKSKQEVLAAHSRARKALKAIRDYLKDYDQYKKDYLASYQTLRTDAATRERLVQVLKRSLNSEKSRAHEKLMGMEEKVFARLYDLYNLLSVYRDRWDFADGAFTFKLARLEKRYQHREELLNRQIREKALHQRIARDSMSNSR